MCIDVAKVILVKRTKGKLTRKDSYVQKNLNKIDFLRFKTKTRNNFFRFLELNFDRVDTIVR